MSTGRGRERGGARDGVDGWAAGRAVLRGADPRMAALVEADPGLDPDGLLGAWPSDLWGALVLQVIGQQLSRAAAAAILGRLEALHGGRLPTPAELLATDAEGDIQSVPEERYGAVRICGSVTRMKRGR